MLKNYFPIDFARKILLPGRPSEETRVEDIMTEEVKGLEKWKIILFEHYHIISPSPHHFLYYIPGQTNYSVQ